MTLRHRAIAPAALAVLVLVATALATRYGVRLHNPQQDEYQVVFGGRFFATDPLRALFDTTAFARGPERLTQMLLAVPDAIFASTAVQMQAGHVVIALAYALTAVPAYLLAASLGLQRGPAAATAALTVLGPWLIFGTAYLDVAVACSTLALLLWASLHAVVRPGWRADLLVLAAAVLAITGRVGAMPFLGVTAVVAIVAAWRSVEPPGPRSRVTRLPRALLRRHPILAPLGLLAVVVVIVVGPRALAGPAYNGAINGLPTVHQLWAYLPVHFAELSMGTGYLPMIIGLPWILTQLVRPASAATSAFAVIAVTSFAIFVGLAAQAGATTEERYVAVLGVLPVVAFGAAMWRREISVLGTALTAIVVGRAVTTQGIYPTDDPFSYFIAPARQFFSNVVLGRLVVSLHTGEQRAALVAMVAIGAVAIVLAIALSGRMRGLTGPRLAAVAGVITAVLCLGGTVAGVYGMRKFSTLAGAPNFSWRQLSFVDERVGSGRVISFNSAVAGDRDRLFEFELARFFNRSIADAFDPNQHLDRKTGRITLPPASYLLRFDGFVPYVMNARTIAQGNAYYGPTGLNIARFRGPAAVLAIATGTPDGVLAPQQDLRVDALAADRGRDCVTISVTGATAGPRTLGYRLSWRGGARSGSIPAGAVRTLRAPFAGGRTVTLRATGAGKTPDGRPVSLYLGAVDVRPCRG